MLTASAVATPNTLPRDAEFRSTLARKPQLAFHFMPQRPAPPDDALVYVLLLHGRDEGHSRPGFARLVVPDEDCTVILAQIDLFARFAGLPELRPVTQVEAVEGELPLRVRHRPRAEQTGA